MVPDPSRTQPRARVLLLRGRRALEHARRGAGRRSARASSRASAWRAGDDVVDGCVFRVPKAYPVYDAAYRDAPGRRCAQFVDGLANLQTIGRNGLHRYNNQDHAVLSGLLAARNLLHGRRFDVWSIGSEADYLEEAPAIAAAG